MAEMEIMNQVAETAIEEVAEKAPVLLNNWQVGGALGAAFGLGTLAGCLVTKVVIKKKAEPKPEKKEKKGFFKNIFKKKEKLEPGQVAADGIEELPDEEPEVES